MGNLNERSESVELALTDQRTTIYTKVLDRFLRHRFAWLFFALLLTLGMVPVLGSRFDFLDLLLAVSLAAAIANAAHERWFLSLLILLGVALLAARAIQVLIGTPALMSLYQLLWVLAVLLATATTARHALGAGPVNAERVFSALDAYLLGGLIFGVCYWLIEQAWPGSFSQSLQSLTQAVYFSFVTIATLGYGDFVPTSDLAKGVAILEAVSGQLYLVVLVARLVSAFH